MVSAPQPEAAWAGTRVLDDGGNAADALVTAALVQGVTDPHRCGVGGFGCATLLFDEPSGPRPLAVDFHGRVGSRATADMWLERFENAAPDGFGYILRDKVNDVGHLAVTVPGMLAGLEEIHRTYGTMDWSGLVERAAEWADEGFVVSPELAEFWIRPGLHGRVSTRDRLGLTEDGRRICFGPDGSPPKAGSRFRQPLLARTYRRIGREGAGSFYRGDLAREIARDLEAHDALVTGEDLASYRCAAHPPLRSSYRGVEVLTSPLPGGGVALLQALALLERIDPDDLEPGTPDTIDRVGRILQAVWADRLTSQGDPAFGTPPAERFLDPDHLDRLGSGAAKAPPRGAESPDTTQLSILDGWGNAISFSHSLGYNSGVFTPGLGVLLNNCMSAFDPRPGHPNSIAPGKARSTAVAETILLRDGRPWLILGSPGAARITAGLVEVISGVVDGGMGVAEAVIAPRFDAYGPGNLLLESRFPDPVVREMERRGWQVIASPRPFGVVGRVYAVEADGIPPEHPIGGVDPGAPGAAFRQRRAP